MNFSVEVADDGARIDTESRVVTTDPDSLWRYGRYWRVIQTPQRGGPARLAPGGEAPGGGRRGDSRPCFRRVFRL